MAQSPQQPQSNIIHSDNFLVSLSGVLTQGKTLLVTSTGFTSRGLVAKIVEHFRDHDFVVYDNVTPNPELVDLKQCFKNLKSQSIVQVIALGGGSVIDSAKVLACLLTNPDIELDVLLQKPSDVLEASVPIFAIPTTSGTGAEVTPFATVWDSEKLKKFSLVNVKPKFAILDPNLTLSLPTQDTLYPALDALSHALESLWNINRTNISQAHATEAIDKICENLPQVLAQPKNIIARKALQQASTLAGLAISQTKTAIAHAISYPLTVKYGVPHGLACSFTLASILQEVGCQRLQISETLGNKILRLLADLKLDIHITKYTTAKNIIEQSQSELDPTRTKNFFYSVDQAMITRIMTSSLAATDHGVYGEN